MTPIKAWYYAIRPKTLSLSATPVLAGLCLSWSNQGFVHSHLAGTTLAVALLIQIGTNLYNDAADHERGADTPERLGPPRATAQGWLEAAQVKAGAALAFGLALLGGMFLSLAGGWPILLLGIGSLLAGYAYTGGPRPIAYSAFGELFVFLFFGLFAVIGTQYLQTRGVDLAALLVGAALGLLASAVLTVNNYRDLETDRKAGKLTLSHHLGRDGSKAFYSAALLLPFVLPLALPSSWPVLLALLPALLLIRHFMNSPGGMALNRQLAATAGLQLGFGLLLCIGVLV